MEKAEAVRLVLLSGGDVREGREAGNGADSMAGLTSLVVLRDNPKIIIAKP